MKPMLLYQQFNYKAMLSVHQQAYKRLDLQHRDISAGNILIDEDGNGLLIDWQFAKAVGKDPHRPRGEMVRRAVRNS